MWFLAERNPVKNSDLSNTSADKSEPKPKTDTRKAAAKSAGVSERKVRQAFLFGSVAQGKEKPESDVDLALLTAPGFDANGLVYTAYEKYGAKVVPLTFSSESKLNAFLKGKQAERLK